MFEISPLQPDDLKDVDTLLDRVFGSDRLTKTSYRFREGVEDIKELGFVARKHGKIVGTVRYWPILIGEALTPALLLGPLAVEPELHGAGVGAGLINLSLAIAAGMKHRTVLLVGDLDYYGRFGFSPAVTQGITMGQETDRLLMLQLDDGKSVTGEVNPAREPAPA